MTPSFVLPLHAYFFFFFLSFLFSFFQRKTRACCNIVQPIGRPFDTLERHSNKQNQMCSILGNRNHTAVRKPLVLESEKNNTHSFVRITLQSFVSRNFAVKFLFHILVSFILLSRGCLLDVPILTFSDRITFCRICRLISWNIGFTLYEVVYLLSILIFRSTFSDIIIPTSNHRYQWRSQIVEVTT